MYLFIRFVASLPPPSSRQRTAEISESADPLVSRTIEPRLTQPTYRSTDFTYGNSQGKVRIFEFSDFACPYCKTLAAELKAAANRHPEVQIVWKDFPLTSLHPGVAGAHRAARCAGQQGKFWEYHDLLFASQGSFSAQQEIALAQELKLDTGKFQECLDSLGVVATIQTNIDEGQALGIDGTPYLFIGDQRISGLLSEEELDQVIALHSQLTK